MPETSLSISPALRRNFTWISLSCGLYWFAFSLTRPIIALYAASLGLQNAAIGIVLAVYALLPMLAAIPSGFIADRFGRTAVMRAGSIMMLASGVLYWISAEPWTLAFAQLLAGLGQLAVWLAVQVLVTEGPAQGSESRFATFSLYMAIGQMAAPIIAGYLADHFGYELVFVGYIVTSLLLIYTSWQCQEDFSSLSGPSQTYVEMKEARGIAAYTVQPSAGHEERWFKQCLKLLQNRKFAVILLATFISLFIVDVRTAYLPLYLESLSISNTHVGLLVSIGAASALFVRPIYPRLKAKLGFMRMLFLTFAVSLLLLFVAPLLTNYYAIAALVFVTGLALGTNQPMTLSMIAVSTAPEERGLGVGLRLMSNRAAQFMDPLLFGFFTTFTSLKMSFVLVGLLLFTCCALALQLYLSAERELPLSEPNLKKSRELQR
jgi:MFS family permease